MKSLGWTLILYDCCSNKRGEFGRGHRHVPRKNNLWRRKFWNQPRTARTLGERPEIDLLAPSGTPLTTFWSYLLLPEPFLLLKPLRLWQFIMPLQLNTMNRAQGAETTQNTSAARGSGHQERVCLLRPRLTKKEHPLTEGFSVPAEVIHCLHPIVIVLRPRPPHHLLKWCERVNFPRKGFHYEDKTKVGLCNIQSLEEREDFKESLGISHKGQVAFTCNLHFPISYLGLWPTAV